MSLRSFARSWNPFFKEQSPLPIALFRIIYSILVIITLILLRPDWLNWYGAHAWLSLPTALKLEPGHRLNLFTIIPQSDAWIEALFWLSLSSAALLTVGLFTRINSILVFVCLTLPRSSERSNSPSGVLGSKNRPISYPAPIATRHHCAGMIPDDAVVACESGVGIMSNCLCWSGVSTA